MNLRSRSHYLHLIFFVLVSAAILYMSWTHVFWRDEAQAWGIASSAQSLKELLGLFAHEGHPPFWHMILYFLQKISTNIELMKIPHLLVALLTIFLIVFKSPFDFFTKILLALNYYLFFEYPVINRAYSFAVLGTILFCLGFSAETKFKRIFFFVSSLALLWCSSVFGIFLAILLQGYLVFTYFSSQKERKKELYFSVLALLPFQLFIAIMMVLTQEVELGIHHYAFSFWRLLSFARMIMVTAFFPQPALQSNFWGILLVFKFVPFEGQILMFLLLSYVLYFTFKKGKISFLFLFISYFLFLLIFSYTRYRGCPRHHGHLFLLWMLIQWLSYEVASPLRKRMVTLILLCGAIPSFFAFYYHSAFPFTAAKINSEAVVRWQESHKGKEYLLVSHPAYIATSTAAYLGQAYYQMSNDRIGRFVIWDYSWEKNQVVSTDDIILRLQEISKNHPNKDLLFVSDKENLISPYLKRLTGSQEIVLSDFEQSYLYSFKPVF